MDGQVASKVSVDRRYSFTRSRLPTANVSLRQSCHSVGQSDSVRHGDDSSMNTKAYLEEHSESKFYPHDFAAMMGLRQASHDFVQAVWLLFKKVKGRISLYDVKKRLGNPDRKELGELEISSYGEHFLDSGAFTQWKIARKWAKRKGKPQKEYYETGRFHRYIAAYAEFIKKYEIGID